jgi:lysophospholipase L1-like esterase
MNTGLYVRFAALGDSATYGLGDPASAEPRGWARLLGEAIGTAHHVSLCNVSRPGATAAEVRARQLTDALDHRPHLASLIVGLNDTVRSSWDPAAVRIELLHAAGLLAAQGAVLLTVRFHDHSRVFGLPRLLAGPLQRRIDDLNAIYDEIHATYGGLQVDLAAHPGVYDREFWSVDRLHPSEIGHRALAHEFSALLNGHGLSFQPPGLELDGDPTTRLTELRTLAAEGLPWLARRLHDHGAVLLGRTLEYIRPGPRSTAARGDAQLSPDEAVS